ncbi:ATP-binding cassette domain-containing protein [Fictibacillus sp. Mic-4]|uniref:ABC transporter ATP-binding protein n=1 Tax=Fictibacillus sp. Mic-4 TaxID=3132826 RepID=UPI003CE8D1E7
MKILHVERLSKCASANESIISDVTVSVEEPSIIHILGGSGAGKSTFLRILGLLDHPDRGQIYYRGKQAKEWLAAEWRRHVAYCAQLPVMLPGTVEDNLRIVSRLHHLSFDPNEVKHLLELVGLSYLDWNKPAFALSGGEKQRVALVRTILMRPEILLVDEVTSSLDINSCQMVENFIKRFHQEEGGTVIWVTHDLEQAKNIGHRVWFFANGRLLENICTPSFFHHPKTEEAKSFISCRTSQKNGNEGVFV